MKAYLFALLFCWPSLVLGQQLTATWVDQSGNPCSADPLTSCQEAEFILERCSGDLASCAAGPFAEVARPPQDAQSWVDTNGLAWESDYTYRISATNAAGTSAWSNLAFAQTTVFVPPVPPDTLITLSCNQVEVAPPVPNSIVSLTLINADTDQPIAGFDPLQNGTLLDLQTLPTRNLNIRANTNPPIVGSVGFNLDNGTLVRTENGAPYAFAGDVAGDYISWTPNLGSHTLTVTSYTGASLGGTAGPAYVLSFSVSD